MLHSWQLTRNYVTRKLGENVAAKVPIFEMAQMAKSRITDRFFLQEKWHFWEQNPLEPNESVCVYKYTIAYEVRTNIGLSLNLQFSRIDSKSRHFRTKKLRT